MRTFANYMLLLYVPTYININYANEIDMCHDRTRKEANGTNAICSERERKREI